MKSIIPTLMIGMAAGALALTTGCQSVSTSAMQEVGAPHYAKVDPAHVDILRTEPTRPHTRLGEVRAETANPDVAVAKIEEALRNKAATLGADAVVVVHDSTRVTGAQVVGGWLNRSIEETESRVVVAIAIKYK